MAIIQQIQYQESAKMPSKYSENKSLFVYLKKSLQIRNFFKLLLGLTLGFQEDPCPYIMASIWNTPK